jgi:hypothetical protein
MVIYLVEIVTDSFQQPTSEYQANSPSRLGFAPDEVYPARPVAGPAVGSYPTFSPLPVDSPAQERMKPSGGLFSAALAVTPSAFPGVTRRHVLRSPDFPPRPVGRGDHPIRLSPMNIGLFFFRIKFGEIRQASGIVVVKECGRLVTIFKKQNPAAIRTELDLLAAANLVLELRR